MQIITSGWVIEPYRYGEKLLTQVTYLVQVYAILLSVTSYTGF